jgi:serine/threonine protein kinase
MSELEVLVARIHGAKNYFEVFGPANGQGPSEHIKRTYRRLARQVHPDRYKTTEEKEKAQEAFKLLGVFYAAAKKAAASGSYGEIPKLVVRTKTKTYEVGDLLTKGEIADLYTATEAGRADDLVFKIARLPLDNELLNREAEALRLLRSGDPKLHPFFPELIDSFLYKDERSVQRRGNILPQLAGWYSLEDLREKFPAGISPLDMAWMWRRILWLLGYAHEQGLVHLAVLPNHVLIQPEMHGVMLVDWCYSQKADDGKYPAAKAASGKYLSWYPKEVTDKVAPSSGTDIYLAAKSMIYLMGGDSNGTFGSGIPRPFAAYFRGCLQDNQKVRPQDAWELLAEFDELLERIGKPYFPRHFHVFTVPK